MKCACEFCNGRGVVTCDDCDGDGEIEMAITSTSVLPSTTHPNHERILDLHKQAKDVERQCRELTELMPSNGPRYRQECKAILDKLSREADRLRGVRP